jgi:hypothetical protein
MEAPYGFLVVTKNHAWVIDEDPAGQNAGMGK